MPQRLAKTVKRTTAKTSGSKRNATPSAIQNPPKLKKQVRKTLQEQCEIEVNEEIGKNLQKSTVNKNARAEGKLPPAKQTPAREKSVAEKVPAEVELTDPVFTRLSYRPYRLRFSLRAPRRFFHKLPPHRLSCQIQR